NPAPFPFPNGLSDVYAPFATAFSISGPTTKSAGTYTLDVTFTDEQLIAPTLTIDAPGTMADVTGQPLTGSGRQWQATIVVPSADGINILDGQWNVSVVGNDDFQGNVFVASSATGSFQTDTSSPQFVSVELDRDPTCYPASVPVTIDLVMNEAGLDARANLTVLDSAMSASASFTDLGGGN